MTIKIRRTGAGSYGKYIKALICGHPGSGKTLLASTFKNPIYANAEAGLMSIADRGIPYADIRSIDDLWQIKNCLDQEPSIRETIMSVPIDTIVIDTLDEIQKILKAERLAATGNPAMQQQDWGWILEQMRTLIRSIRNMPINAVFLCHLKEVQDQTTGRTYYKPDLEGAIADGIAQYFDLSMVIESQTGTVTTDKKVEKIETRRLITKPSQKYSFLKDRSGKLPEYIDINFEDDYDKIHSLIFDDVSLNDEQEISVEPPTPVNPAATKSRPKTEPQNCEICGDEAEPDIVKLSRVRFRKILDKKCYTDKLNNKTKKTPEKETNDDNV